ncbi:unnamed protein product [Sphenostylis stenocarpa]|uniref:Uncharacterized protein n=1 Tax=Sphenostylis stenocarpa TaxID=92480 RepID=A0AA86SWM9_9FABA|nr:unnamed protein product [Sphenostylis stenocarpa]
MAVQRCAVIGVVASCSGAKDANHNGSRLVVTMTHDEGILSAVKVNNGEIGFLGGDSGGQLVGRDSGQWWLATRWAVWVAEEVATGRKHDGDWEDLRLRREDGGVHGGFDEGETRVKEQWVAVRARVGAMEVEVVVYLSGRRHRLVREKVLRPGWRQGVRGF